MHLAILDPLDEPVCRQLGQQSSALGRIGRTEEKSRGGQIIFVIYDALMGGLAGCESAHGQKDHGHDPRPSNSDVAYDVHAGYSYRCGRRFPAIARVWLTPLAVSIGVPSISK
jgi:hypothetical protein